MSHDHYFIDVSAYDRIDVYRLIELIGITCPVAQHVFKKAFATGKRGHKDLRRDWQDIADSAARRLQMMDEDDGWTQAAIAAAALPKVGTPVEWPEDESRIDIIGQNGPTAEHYAHACCGIPADYPHKMSCEKRGGRNE